MTNEEKAREISQQWWSDCGWQLQATANDAALEAMRWKDEQHAQEKQQWIEKACEFFNSLSVFFNNDGKLINAIYEEFKKAMEEQL